MADDGRTSQCKDSNAFLRDRRQCDEKNLSTV